MVTNVPAMVQHIGNLSFYGSDVGRILKLCSGATYVGSSAFTKTAVNLIYYCGVRDFSHFSSSFESGAKAIVSDSYPSYILCGAATYHITANSCSDVMQTNFNYDALAKRLENIIAPSTFIIASTKNLGLW